ncbi:hypothetical protein [Longimicrobium sp.]|jgi:hypothetical protein|uniref:hypothetical protein n=1 Tax=Longimicrobium sp. TaxID=2029185 RepID=UPI002ED9E438
MNAISHAWNRLCSWRLRGNWRPGSTNTILLIAQVVTLWTAAQRGMDYLTLPVGAASSAELGGSEALRGIEADISLKMLGLSFLAPAGLAFISLAMGWVRGLSVGHLLVGVSYLVLGITFLRDSPVDDWLTAGAGSALLLVAAGLLVTDSRRVPDILALLGGALAMGIGGWLAAHGLGSGYRTGNGFLGAAVLHLVFGFGTQILARRDERLRREEEEDLRDLRLLGD